MKTFQQFLLERSQQNFQDFFKTIEITANHLWKVVLDPSSKCSLTVENDDKGQKRDFILFVIPSSDLDKWMENDFKQSIITSQFHLPEFTTLPINIRFNIREHLGSTNFSGYMIPSNDENTLVINIMLHKTSLLGFLKGKNQKNSEEESRDLTQYYYKNKKKFIQVINTIEIKSILHHELTHIFQKSTRHDFYQNYSSSINHEYHLISKEIFDEVERFILANKQKPVSVNVVYDYLLSQATDEMGKVLKSSKNKILKELDHFIRSGKRTVKNDWQKSSFEFEAVLSQILEIVKSYLKTVKNPKDVSPETIYNYISNIGSPLPEIKSMLKQRKAKVLQSISRFLKFYY